MLLAGIMLAALLLAGCTSADTARRMRMGVAGEGGVYHAFGEGFAALENDSGNGAVELKNTAGSAANLRLLMGDYLQLAVAQADLVQDAYEQSGIFQDEEMENKFCAVAALYTEACQVIVRADSDIQSVEELQGKTVSIGAEESGSEQNAWQILSAYGLNEKLVETINLNYEDAAAQLKAGRIDAMFITVGAPSAVVTALAEDCGIRLLCVDGAAAKRLQDSCSSYSVCTIPAGTYPGQEEEVQTVGVKAVLLASAALPEKQVEQLTKLLFDGRENLSTQLGIRLDTEAEATEGVGIPFHKGAAAYYKTADITVASCMLPGNRGKERRYEDRTGYVSDTGTLGAGAAAGQIFAGAGADAGKILHPGSGHRRRAVRHFYLCVLRYRRGRVRL